MVLIAAVAFGVLSLAVAAIAGVSAVRLLRRRRAAELRVAAVAEQNRFRLALNGLAVLPDGTVVPANVHVTCRSCGARYVSSAVDARLDGAVAPCPRCKSANLVPRE